MNLKLQRFDYRSSKYERPNQDWTCGRLAQGKPCRMGPGVGGVCRAMAECRPLKKGDRWVCTRSDTSGGKCATGPLPDGSCCNPIPPCSPQPSMRRKRGMLTRYAIATIVGLLLIIGAGSYGDALFSPGPLSSSHAEVGECADCHSVSERGPLGWMNAMFSPHTEAEDVKNCVACHTQRDGLAHNQTADVLAALSEKAMARANDSRGPFTTQIAASLGVPVRTNAEGEVACRSCHQEHRGIDAEIAELTNANCQSCHTAKFESFSKGHPEFTSYPYERRTRIQFNHQSHISKYFQDDNFKNQAPATCRTCHLPDDQGKLMLIGGFEENCAACHGEFIADKPLIALTLPGLDLETLEEYEIRIGEWPVYAEAEEFSPIVDVLLAGDEDYVAARAALLEEEIDLFDLTEVEDEIMEHVVTIVWAYKGLIYDILTEGPALIQERLAENTGVELSAESVNALIGNLHLDTLTQVQEDWFPDLYAEVEAYRDDLTVSALLIEDEPEGNEFTTDSETWSEGGGWFTEGYSLNYKLSGHGDDVMQAWLNLAASPAADEGPLAEVLNQLADAKGPGGCITCHSIDTVEEGKAVNWHGRKAEPQVAVFSEFVHAKHFSLIGDQGCATCHQIDSEADYEGSFADYDSSSFVSNFKPLDQQVCADCHTAEVAGNTCTMCHNYHVGVFPPAAVDTDMMAAGQ